MAKTGSGNVALNMIYICEITQKDIVTMNSPILSLKLSHKKSDETRNMNLVNFVLQKSPNNCCLGIIKDVPKYKKIIFVYF